MPSREDFIGAVLLILSYFLPLKRYQTHFRSHQLLVILPLDDVHVQLYYVIENSPILEPKYVLQFNRMSFFSASHIYVLASDAIHVVNLTSQHSQLFVRTAVMFTFRQGHGQWLPPADERACPHEAQRHEYKKSTLLTCVPTSVPCIGYLKMWIVVGG